MSVCAVQTVCLRDTVAAHGCSNPTLPFPTESDPAPVPIRTFDGIISPTQKLQIPLLDLPRVMRNNEISPSALLNSCDLSRIT